MMAKSVEGLSLLREGKHAIISVFFLPGGDPEPPNQWVSAFFSDQPK